MCFQELETSWLAGTSIKKNIISFTAVTSSLGFNSFQEMASKHTRSAASKNFLDSPLSVSLMRCFDRHLLVLDDGLVSTTGVCCKARSTCILSSLPLTMLTSQR